MKKLSGIGVSFLIVLLTISSCGGGGGNGSGGNRGGNGDGDNGGGQPISYENYSFEYLYYDGSGYKLDYSYARNGLKSLQMFTNGAGIHIELATGVTTYFNLNNGTATKNTESANINSNLLISLGVIGAGSIGERIGGETLDDNFCDIVKLTGNSSSTFIKMWYCKRFDIMLKSETYVNDKLDSGFYLKQFQLGNCSNDMVKLPEGLDILD